MKNMEPTMRCPDCNGKMIPLFTSCVCDRCDGKLDADSLHKGWVVWSGPPDGGRQVYVFRTRQVAQRWQRLNKMGDAQVRQVLSDHEINWHLGRGSIQDLELADHLFEVYPDQCFEPQPHRAFLAPAQA